MALEAVKRIDALFDIERDINRLAASERLARRQQDSRRLVEKLEAWMRAEQTKLSRSSPVAEPIDYMLKRWEGFTSFLGDGRICLTEAARPRDLQQRRKLAFRLQPFYHNSNTQDSAAVKIRVYDAQFGDTPVSIVRESNLAPTSSINFRSRSD